MNGRISATRPVDARATAELQAQLEDELQVPDPKQEEAEKIIQAAFVGKPLKGADEAFRGKDPIKSESNRG